eukprot:gene9204-biopygen6426
MLCSCFVYPRSTARQRRGRGAAKSQGSQANARATPAPRLMLSPGAHRTVARQSRDSHEAVARQSWDIPKSQAPLKALLQAIWRPAEARSASLRRRLEQ